MQSLVKELLNSKLSRRGFLAGMAAAGYSASAAQSALQSVAPFVPRANVPQELSRISTGTGGDLMLEQLIQAGAEYIFVCNGSGLGPLCDALVSRPQVQLIQSTHEGQAVAVADGYAKASGKIGFVMYSRVGLPNSTSNMYNAMKDRTPLGHSIPKPHSGVCPAGVQGGERAARRPDPRPDSARRAVSG
jgi:hypothetical protein